MVAEGQVWIPHAWPIGILTAVALFGGPAMMKEAAFLDRLGAPAYAKFMRYAAWGSMFVSTPVAMAFYLRWI
jgi:hypothetical protein